MKTYHVGIMLGSTGIKGIHETARHREGTVAVYLTDTIDELPCEIHKYEGEREITKRQLSEGKDKILRYYQEVYPERKLKRVVIV